MEEFHAIVLDNGSGTIKVGYGGYEEPTRFIPSLLVKKGKGDYVCGEEAVKLSEQDKTASVIRPIKWSIVQDWDATEALWKHSLEGYVELRQ